MSTSSSYHNNDNSKSNDAIAGKRAAAAGVPVGAQQASSANVPPEPPIDRADADPISFKRNGVANEVRDPQRTAARRAAASKYI